MRKRWVFALLSAVMLQAAACGSDPKETASQKTGQSAKEDAVPSSQKEDAAGTERAAATEKESSVKTGDKGAEIVYDGEDANIATRDLPKDYKILPFKQFEAGFKAIVDGKITTGSTYEDVAAAFGGEGIRMTGIVYQGYTYYSWYCDQDYYGGMKTHVIITFQNKNGRLMYYAYTSQGITPQDVREKEQK